MTTSTRAVTSTADSQRDSQHEAVADFVRRFERTWARPDPDRINGLVHSDIEFFQPLEGVVHGHDEARAFWRRLFTLIPDIHGEVLSWGFGDGVLYIELRMIGTLAGKPIDWVTLDRIRLEDGKVRQRIAYFNPLPLVRAVLTRPRAWPLWIAAQRQRRS